MQGKRRSIFARLSSKHRDNKKKHETNNDQAGEISKSNPETHTVHSDNTVREENQLGRTLNGLIEEGDDDASTSSESNVTSASDLMKCLNSLRIQEASVTNSNSTPSAASIPRIAPPPKSLSEPDGSTEMFQTWPRLESQNSGQHSAASVSLTEKKHKLLFRNRQVSNESSAWVAFSSDVKREAEELVTSGGNSRSPSLDVCSNINITEEPSEEAAPLPLTPPATETSDPSLELQNTEDLETKEVEKEEDNLNVDSVEEPQKQTLTSIDEKTKVAENTQIGFEKHWRDSDEDSIAILSKGSVEVNPFAEPSIQKVSSTGSLVQKLKHQEEENLDTIMKKYGTPSLELVETVDACFSGNKLSQYKVWGEIKFKLLGGLISSSLSQNGKLSSTAIECLEVCRLVLRLKCVLQRVFIKKIVVKKSLMEWDGQNHHHHQQQQQHQQHQQQHEHQEQQVQEETIARSSSLTMNEARQGVVESKVMHWNLPKCFEEALINPVTLIKYPVQPSISCGPPLVTQIYWQRPKRPGNPVLVDVIVAPNKNLSTSLWGVTVCLKGFGNNTRSKNNNCSAKYLLKEALASPEAKWNPTECSFEWSIPIINPQDSARHLKVKVSEEHEEIPDYDLSASVKFVMPHSTLSGTLLMGWIERNYGTESDALFGDDSRHITSPTKAMPTNNSNLIFCEKMCLSGDYSANINY